MIRGCALACALALLTAPAWAAQAPADELKALRARLEKLKRDIARSEESRNEAADALKASEVAISEANARLRELAAARNDVEARLQALGEETQAVETRLAEQRRLAARLLSRHYTGTRNPGTLEMLLSGRDPNAIARDRVYLEYVAQARKRVLDGLVAESERLRGLLAESAQRRSEIAVIEAEEARQRARLQAERENRRRVLAKVSAEIARQRQEAAALERDERRLAKLVDDLAKALAARRAAPRPRTGGSTAAEPRVSGAFAQLKGRLHPPVRGVVKERFGSPRADSGLTWRGLFIAAPAGQEVKAVAAGRVVFADWLRGFGNLLILDHGDGFMSLYGYNETILARLGEAVRGGEAIATVGATGGNTTTGLYFELRYQGKPFDPLGWLNLE